MSFPMMELCPLVAQECETLRLRLRTDHPQDDKDSSVIISDDAPSLIEVLRLGRSEAAELSRMEADLASPVQLDGDSMVRLALFRLSTDRNLFVRAGIMIAALAAYLRKLTADDDLVIGFPVRARTTCTALTTPRCCRTNCRCGCGSHP